MTLRILFIALLVLLLSAVSTQAQSLTCIAGAVCKIAGDTPTAVTDGDTGYALWVDGISRSAYPPASIGNVVGQIIFSFIFGVADIGVRSVQLSATNAGGTSKSTVLSVTVVPPPAPAPPTNVRIVP